MSNRNNYETPPYDVIARRNGYEIRRYRKQVWAQTTYDVPLNNDSSSAQSGFFPLFGYISGNNNRGMKISMTTPVVRQETSNGTTARQTMSFIMSPSTFTSSSQLPAANDRNIRIVEEPNSRDMACITFNMYMNRESKTAKENELRQAAYQDGLVLSSNKADVLYCGYDDPSTNPYDRRNEVCIPILGQR